MSHLPLYKAQVSIAFSDHGDDSFTLPSITAVLEQTNAGAGETPIIIIGEYLYHSPHYIYVRRFCFSSSQLIGKEYQLHITANGYDDLIVTGIIGNSIKSFSDANEDDEYGYIIASPYVTMQHNNDGTLHVIVTGDGVHAVESPMIQIGSSIRSGLDATFEIETGFYDVTVESGNYYTKVAQAYVTAGVTTELPISLDYNPEGYGISETGQFTIVWRNKDTQALINNPDIEVLSAVLKGKKMINENGLREPRRLEILVVLSDWVRTYILNPRDETGNIYAEVYKGGNQVMLALVDLSENEANDDTVSFVLKDWLCAVPIFGKEQVTIPGTSIREWNICPAASLLSDALGYCYEQSRLPGTLSVSESCELITNLESRIPTHWIELMDLYTVYSIKSGFISDASTNNEAIDPNSVAMYLIRYDRVIAYCVVDLTDEDTGALEEVVVSHQPSVSDFEKKYTVGSGDDLEEYKIYSCYVSEAEYRMIYGYNVYIANPYSKVIPLKSGDVSRIDIIKACLWVLELSMHAGATGQVVFTNYFQLALGGDIIIPNIGDVKGFTEERFNPENTVAPDIMYRDDKRLGGIITLREYRYTTSKPKNIGTMKIVRKSTLRLGNRIRHNNRDLTITSVELDEEEGLYTLEWMEEN